MEVDVKEQQVVKSLNDRRDYRVLKLDNGLTALLISDTLKKNKRNSQTTPDQQINGTDNEEISNEADSDGDSEMDGDASESYGDDDSDSNDGDDSDGDDVGENGGDAHGDKTKDEEDVKSSKRKSIRRETKLAAGALCVGIGSFSDPEELPGLAHFLEHMVFMGSAKYPDENAFDAFIKKHGGSTNAFTDCERTVFKFEVRPKYFKESLDRFAQFFVSPLMKKGSMEREIKAVDSEFRMSYQDDNSRKMQLFGSLTTEAGHPFGKFLWGNEESLSTNPQKLGIDVNNSLQLFWKKMYSSHQMTLAVLSNETLDVLEEWITDIFTLIPRRNSRDSVFYDINNTCGFTPDKFHKLYKVVPVKDIHEVEITWVLPPLQKYYRTKPLNYISWLLGHESRGSVLAWLKEKGWATALCAGNSGSGQEFNAIYSFFTCEVYLTVSGLEHYVEVIAVIFQYLEMLRRIGPNSRVFNEIKSIEDNNFRFKEEVDPLDYVEEIAECMQLYPEEDYLTGSDLMLDFDEKIITDIQNNLTPDKANIMLISKTLSNECTEKEKWFDTQYCVQDIDIKLKDCLKDLNRDLYLPEENTFIAENFDVYSCEKAHSKFPVMIHECASGKVWHKQDDTFFIPKAIFNFYFKSPLINCNAKNMVLTEMFALLLDFDLKDVAYAADVAGLSYRITVCQTGIIMNFGGFSDKLHVLDFLHKLKASIEVLDQFKKNKLLFQKVIEHMNTFEVKETQFNMVKEQGTRAYYNRIIKPQKLVRAVRLKILQDVKWTENDKRVAVLDITLDHFKYFSEELKSTFYIESLFQGNITSQARVSYFSMSANEIVYCLKYTDAIAYQTFIYRTLKFEPLLEDLHPQIKVVQLPNYESICKIEGFNRKDENTVITNYYQIGPASGKDLTYLELLMDIMEEPCFDVLRTKEQLGYSVFCGSRITNGILGFSLTVQTQAEKYSADFVKERMDHFLDDFLRNLPNIDPDVFKNHVSSMIEIKQHEDLNLAEEVDRNWNEVTNETYSFERLNNEVKFLRALRKESFLKWVSNTLSDLFSKKLSVQILGHKRASNDEAGEMDADCDISEKSWALVPVTEAPLFKICISDINLFKQNLTLFPISKIY